MRMMDIYLSVLPLSLNKSYVSCRKKTDYAAIRRERHNQ